MDDTAHFNASMKKQPSLTIPPRPDVVTVLVEERERDDPNLKRVARALMGDVALSGAMLKAVNAPAFGLSRKVTSVAAAIDLLGMRNVGNLAMGLALRYSQGESAEGMERFWDSAEKVAMLSAYLAGRLKGVAKDEAYTYGLFHDCGIPLLAQRYPDYKTVLATANQTLDRSATAVEDMALGTHHASVGYFLARSWYLAEDISQAILLHHDLGIYEASPRMSERTLNLIGIGHLAQHIHHTSLRSSEDVEWIKFEAPVCRHFGLDDEDLVNLVEDGHHFLATGEGRA